MPGADQTFAGLLALGRAFVSVTIVDSMGSAPGAIGSRLLVTDEGSISGTVGGGKLEARALAEARRMLAGAGEHFFFDWSLNKDIGMTCGGRVRLYLELHNSSVWDIHVFGAGHVAQALIRILLTVNCRVYCYDTREEWLSQLPQDPRLHPRRPERLRDAVVGIPETAFVLLMTMGHATDLPVLTEILMTRAQEYLGVIGSKSKRAVLHRELLAQGITQDVAENFYCPIGLPIGSSAPPEIAVSVVAQLLAERDRLNGPAHSNPRPTAAVPAEPIALSRGPLHG